MKFPYQDQFKHLGPVVTDADGSHYIDAGPTKRERAMSAADFLNSGDKWRVLNCTADYPQCGKGGMWYVNIRHGSGADGYRTHAELIELAKQEGWQEVKDGYFKRKTNELVNQEPQPNSYTKPIAGLRTEVKAPPFELSDVEDEHV